MKVIKYFAYGSNMHEKDLERWCKKKNYEPIKPLERRVAVLKNWKLVFNYYSTSRKGGAANIKPQKGCEVWGILMVLKEEDYKKIKKKEGAPYYYKEITVEVETKDGKKIYDVKTFKVAEEHEEEDDISPTREHLNILIESAEKYRFPRWYIEMLKYIKTKD